MEVNEKTRLLDPKKKTSDSALAFDPKSKSQVREYLSDAESSTTSTVMEIKESDPANERCFDCGNVPTCWASVNLAIFLCLNCASQHRSYGVHISFVRSLTLDTWKEKQIYFMQIGGNQRLQDFFEEKGISENSPKEQYFSNHADDYRLLLASRVHQDLGLPMPEPPKPKSVSNVYSQQTSISSDPSYDPNKNYDTSSCPNIIGCLTCGICACPSWC